MKNIIEYYYNLRIDELHNNNDVYHFDLNNNHFTFKPYTDNIDKSYDIYKLNTIISNKLNIDSIIPNKYNNPLTKVYDTYYILILNKTKVKLSLPLISNMALSNINITSLERNKWELLWESKIDYYELQVRENEKKYPLIRESFNYFIGMAENAISYLVNTKLELKPTITDQKVISHNNKNIFKELNEYFYYNYYSLYGIRILFSRILYPSFYFILYDEIISNKKEEKELNKIISRINDYEVYLYNIYLYLRKHYDIPTIEWLKKRGPNPHLQP